MQQNTPRMMLSRSAGSAPLARAIARLRRIALPVQAALVLACFTIAFLWAPLTQRGYYTSTDILQGSELLTIAPPGYAIKNGVIADPVDQMIPFLAWNRDQLWAGKLPLWNPYSGWGAPHLANYQSAVFSPFSLPFYLLGMRAALVVAAFLKLWSLGYATYLFLRSVAVRHTAALAGAVAFMFSGYNVLWLSWPHVGAGVALPAGMYCVERALQAGAAQPRRRGLALAGLALALAAGLVAGHPETFFYATLLLGAYTLFRLARSTRRWPERMRRLGELALAGILALGLAAAQLLPFAEYLAHSTIADARRADQKLYSLNPQLIALQAFPDLLGNPTLAYYDRALAKTTNYNEANSPYIGLAVLFLAGLAVLMLLRHRSPLVLFFTASGLLWLLYAYDVAGAATVLSRLPMFNVGVVSRSHIIWLFSVSCLAGLAVDCVLAPAPAIQLRGRSWAASPILLAGAALVWGLALAGVAAATASGLLEWAASQPGNAVASAAASAARQPHVRFIAITYGLAVACVVAIAAGLGRRLGRYAALGAAAVVVLIFLQSGFLLKDYNPTIEDRYFYPISPALEAISRQTGPAQTLRVDAALLPADSNLWYRLRSPSNYDAIGVRAYDRMHAELMRSAAYLETAKPATLSALRVMGIQYIATTRPYPFAARADRPPAPGAAIRATDSLAPDRPIRQLFTATAPNLAAISMPLAAFKRLNRCSLVATLEDVAAHTLVARASSSCADVQDNRAYVLSFPPQPHSQGRQYQLTFASPDATHKSTLAAYYAAGAVPGEALSVGREAIAGRLVFETYSVTVAGLERIWSDGRVNLFRVPGSLPQFYAVSRAVAVRSDDEALAVLGRSDFDPATTVLIQGDLPVAAAADRPEQQRVEVLQETPTHIQLRVVRDAPGWLVALQTFYPGWTAHVNGRRQAIARANLAFSAVPVGAGVSEVVLDYDPASVRYGLIVSALSAVALLAACALLLAGRGETQ